MDKEQSRYAELEKKIISQLSQAYYNGLDRKGWSQFKENDAVDDIMSAVDTYVDQILLRIMGTKTEGLFDNGDLFIKRAPLEQEIINIVGYEKWKAMQELLGFERTKAGL